MKLADKILEKVASLLEKGVVTNNLKSKLHNISSKIVTSLSKHVKVSETEIVIDTGFVEDLVKGSGWKITGMDSRFPHGSRYFIKPK